MKKLSLHNMFRMVLGMALLIGALGRIIIYGPISELPQTEMFLIPMLFIIGIYFMHSAFISDLGDRIKRLEKAQPTSSTVVEKSERIMERDK